MSSSSDFTEVSHTASRPCPTKKCQKLLKIVNCPLCRTLGTKCTGIMRCSGGWDHALEDKLLWDKFEAEDWEERERPCDECLTKANFPASAGPCNVPDSSLVEDTSHVEAVKRSIAAAAENGISGEDAPTEDETDPRFDLFTVGSDTGETITTQVKSTSGEPAEEGPSLLDVWMGEDPEGYSSSGESGLHNWDDLGNRPRSVLLDSDVEEPTPIPSPEPEQTPYAEQPAFAAEPSESSSAHAASLDAFSTDREAVLSIPPSPAASVVSALSAPASVNNMLAETMETLLVVNQPAEEAAPATEDQEMATPWRESPEIPSPLQSPAPSHEPESEDSDGEGSDSSGSASFWLAALSDAFGGIAIEDFEDVTSDPLRGCLVAHSPIAAEFVPLPLSQEPSVAGDDEE